MRNLINVGSSPCWKAQLSPWPPDDLSTLKIHPLELQWLVRHSFPGRGICLGGFCLHGFPTLHGFHGFRCRGCGKTKLNGCGKTKLKALRRTKWTNLNQSTGRTKLKAGAVMEQWMIVNVFFIYGAGQQRWFQHRRVSKSLLFIFNNYTRTTPGRIIRAQKYDHLKHQLK